MTPRTALPLLCTLLACLPAQSPAQESDAALGRLFNTPQRRASLDGMRERNLRVAPAEQSDSVRLDGIVLRSDGRSTVWFNNQAITDQAQALRADPSSARIPTGPGASQRLRVGETLQTTPPQGARP